MLLILLKPYNVISIIDTLLDFDVDQRVGYLNTISENGVTCTERMYDDYYQINRQMRHRLDALEISLEELFVRCHEVFFKNIVLKWMKKLLMNY